ncbi:MAG: hybrid sensor histidine kinase/response regulator [Planctomycetota bacterium]|nr:MAG: hybrid sensor histidine kinase/response regulator [Planctomycetota bacterium]
MKRDILYVDDEPSNLIVFEAAFEETFNVYTAANADEALNFLKSQPVPVVVADQRMPDMTGVEMFGLIRKIYPHTQRVILSGFADSDAIIDAINEGQVFQFVRKPWQRVELLSVLHRALDAHDLAVQNSVLTERLLVSERCAMLGQASGRIAHEMANQLNILPLIELIEDDYREDEQLLEFAEVARLTYERLTELIEEVKAFVRFQPQNAELKPLDLDESIHELASFIRFSRTVPQEQLSIDIRARPKILGHKLKLHQVLVNLIKNASHAIADRTEGRVQVMLDKADGDAVISVSDNGTGISPENLERIWEPFFSTKGDAGNGMGLDVAKRLIAAQNGEICCESELGKGTCFTIRIPLLAEGKDDSPEKNSAAPANPSSAKPVPLS